MNTKITYLYRDDANNKAINEVVINGRLTEEQQKVIINCCDGGWFVPSQVCFPEIRLGSYDKELDHSWFEFDESYCTCFQDSDDTPTIDMTPEDVVKQFTSVKDWDYNDKSWINDYDHDDEEDED